MNQAKTLKRHRYILEKLASSNSKDRKKILENAPSELFKVLNLVFKLINEKKLTLSKRQNTTVNRHKKLIRKASGLKSSGIKAALVKHRGAGLSTILSAVIPVLAGLVQSIL